MSVLDQPECLELLVADGGSTDGSLQQLEELTQADSRVQIISRSDAGPADALNKAFKAARGTLIGWLNADDLYAPNALKRAAKALSDHPDWLMVYGEADHIDSNNEPIEPYPTQKPTVGIREFRNGCFICQPSVVFRRSMGVLLGPFNVKLLTAFDFDYWLRAFEAFPDRIGFIPNVQAYSRLHGETITSNQRQQVALEAMQLIKRHFGASPKHWLYTAAEELLDGSNTAIDLNQLLQQALPLLSLEDQSTVREEVNAMQAAKRREQDGDWGNLSASSLLQLLRPELFKGFQKAKDPEQALNHYITNNGTREYSFIRHQKQQSLGKNGLKESTNTNTSFPEKPFGVNLIGYAQGQLGIGEDLRCTAAALDTAGVPTAILNFPPGKEVPQNDHSLDERLVGSGPFAFNIFCLTAEEIARFLMERGPAQFQQCFNIGYTPWELKNWPGPWLPLLGLCDQFWASSSHTLSAMRQGLTAPNQAAPHPLPTLELLPLAVTSADEKNSDRVAIRRHYGLPQQAVVFTFSFDLNSSIHRKNPVMALRAFQRAFPPGHPLATQVALLIKTHAPKQANVHWDRLKAEATADSRLHILETTLSRTELLNLYAACDGFISLHRAEGFGRGLAEALMLGLDVIATDHGGNTDFCTGPMAHPVRCKLVRVNNGEYPYHRGQRWAQPSVAHAAELLQQVTKRRLEQGLPDATICEHYRRSFDPGSCGERYKKQLYQLWEKRKELAEHLRFKG